MSKKEIQFSVKLNVDGKEQFGTITTSTRALVRSLDDARRTSTKLSKYLSNVNQAAGALNAMRDALQGLCADSNAYSAAMAKANTMAGKQGEEAAIFTALVKPSSEATKMAQQMGIAFNAAAIKSAGGFRQFLTTLDSEVQVYASKTGMLSQEIYAKLFGSAESLRALGPLTNQLKDKFAQNAEAMANSAGTIDDAFSTMSSTGGAQMQLLRSEQKLN